MVMVYVASLVTNETRMRVMHVMCAHPTGQGVLHSLPLPLRLAWYVCALCFALLLLLLLLLLVVCVES